jgi:putative transposase
MARLARIVVPGLPHHVTQRGNRRQPVFFEDGDYALYRDLLAERCRKAGVAVWAYCLMPNHVHLILVPATTDALALALGETHRRYTGFVNARLRVTGHLFQGRFGSVVLDETHLIAAARYVALNPVRAGLVQQASQWPWSSVRAHLRGRDDGLVEVAPLIARSAGRFADLLDAGPTPQEFAAIRAAETIGRPLGGPAFLDRLEATLGRTVRPAQRGRPKRLTEERPNLAGAGKL